MLDDMLDSFGKILGWLIIIIVLLAIFFSAPAVWILFGIIFLALKMID